MFGCTLLSLLGLSTHFIPYFCKKRPPPAKKQKKTICIIPNFYIMDVLVESLWICDIVIYVGLNDDGWILVVIESILRINGSWIRLANQPFPTFPWVLCQNCILNTRNKRYYRVRFLNIFLIHTSFILLFYACISLRRNIFCTCSLFTHCFQM